MFWTSIRIIGKKSVQCCPLTTLWWGVRSDTSGRPQSTKAMSILMSNLIGAIHLCEFLDAGAVLLYI